MSHKLYTIGHSAIEFPTFVTMLRRSEVSLLVDVRSKPQSLRFPHFDQVELERAVRAEAIDYVFLGEELGGRPEDPKAYGSDGIVDYLVRRKSYAFRAGIERVLQELAKNDLVLMCSEEDPLNCHRFLMICPELVALGLEPHHIRKGGLIECQRDAEDRLLQIQHWGAIAGASLFSSDRETALASAFTAQAKKCAFRLDPAELDRWQAG
jgi:uncharacterized protein (DUF488 family)